MPESIFLISYVKTTLVASTAQVTVKEQKQMIHNTDLSIYQVRGDKRSVCLRLRSR